jgi:hypothetical protein
MCAHRVSSLRQERLSDSGAVCRDVDGGSVLLLNDKLGKQRVYIRASIYLNHGFCKQRWWARLAGCGSDFDRVLRLRCFCPFFGGARPPGGFLGTVIVAPSLALRCIADLIHCLVTAYAISLLNIHGRNNTVIYIRPLDYRGRRRYSYTSGTLFLYDRAYPPSRRLCSLQTAPLPLEFPELYIS